MRDGFRRQTTTQPDRRDRCYTNEIDRAIERPWWAIG